MLPAEYRYQNSAGIGHLSRHRRAGYLTGLFNARIHHARFHEMLWVAPPRKTEIHCYPPSCVFPQIAVHFSIGVIVT